MSSKKINLKNKNPYIEVKAKILDMSYNKENNLFQILFKDIEKDKQVHIAIKGTDWGITQDIPENIIEQFCKEMIGKEKNLHIETGENHMPSGISKTESIISSESLDKIHDELDRYPINEVKNVLHEEEQQENGD